MAQVIRRDVAQTPAALNLTRARNQVSRGEGHRNRSGRRQTRPERPSTSLAPHFTGLLEPFLYAIGISNRRRSLKFRHELQTSTRVWRRRLNARWRLHHHRRLDTHRRMFHPKRRLNNKQPHKATQHGRPCMHRVGPLHRPGRGQLCRSTAQRP